MTVPETRVFHGLEAVQSSDHRVVSFPARPDEILSVASIDRIGRDATGQVRGFQRSQIAAHIREIKDYLVQSNAVLPNLIVLAFVDGVTTAREDSGLVRVEVDVSNGPIGWVVDGQQRLTALVESGRTDFQVFVSALVCPSDEELRRQFVLINNTRPLPKSLIYELLPGVSGLPSRLSARSFAARMTERLNYDETSSLRGEIQQHTNPSGVVKDTAVQRVIMNSVADGALRELMHTPEGEEESFQLLSEFFWAVKGCFDDAWTDHTPRTSRLVHGAGIVALGYVMEVLFARDNARTRDMFFAGLECLRPHCAWTSGSWAYGEGDLRPWNSIQNVNRQIVELSHHLIRLVKANPPANTPQDRVLGAAE